jgi:single-strand DNA-binding protein
MNSFTLTAIGQLAKDPETTTSGEHQVTKFALIGNDYNGADKEESVTSVFFVAFNGIGETIANNCRKGDQLIIEAQMKSNNWVDNTDRKRYDYSYIVQSFKFGAPGKIKREELARAAQQAAEPPPASGKSNKRNRGRAASQEAPAGERPPF